MLYNALRQFYHRHFVVPKIQKIYASLSTTETFRRIYANQEWTGPQDEAFRSGTGSGGTAATIYCARVAEFIKTNNVQSVADLGCGDFRVGQQITHLSPVNYVGVDIVPELITRNAVRFGSERISFVCANLAADKMPPADLCLVRQVLQHLSNAEIQDVLAHISHYRFALITEHVHKSPKSFNKDKPHGPDVRTSVRSGVYIEHPPFSRPASLLWEDELDQDSVLRTVLLKS